MQTKKIDPIHRRPAVETITGLSRSSIYERMALGKFPKSVKLSERAVGWRESDLVAWLSEREQAA